MVHLRLARRMLPLLVTGLLILFGSAACATLTTTMPAAADSASPASDGGAGSQSATETVTLAVTNTASAETVAAAGDQTEVVRPAGWSGATHSNDVDPNFAIVFPQDQVNSITFTVTADVWAAMQANMTELAGEPGSEPGMRGGPGGEPPAVGELPEGMQPPAPGERPEGGPGDGGPGFGGGSMLAEKPMWVTATVEFEGNTWTNVGLRYKGNSSLVSPWRSGSLKLPFKLDFDQWEDEYPEIDNQRFYGFKQLSLANNFSDNSFMRDALTYDLLDEAGLVAGETAFYEVFLDHGEGPVSLGLYTMVEVIDDTVVARYFGGDDGNLYEADGAAASLADGTYDQIESSFEKENNEDAADWSDIETLYENLHSEQRTTDPAAWRASLEAVFDVDTFLEWLALSAVINHWDTYGAMNHNYYLYHNPETDRLTWISWDHNMTMQSGEAGQGLGAGAVPDANITQATGEDAAIAPRGPGGGPGGRGGMSRSVSLDKSDVGDNWPLIRYLLDDPTYSAAYLNYLVETADTLYLPDAQAAKIQTWAAMLAPYAEEEIGADRFASAIEELTQFAYTRTEAVQLFLSEAQPDN